MSNIKKSLIAVAVLTPMLFLTGHVMAEGGGKFRGCQHERGAGDMSGHPQRIERMFKKLDLDQQQQDSIKQIIAEKRDTREAIAGQLKDSRMQMKEMRGQPYDAQKFSSLAQQHAEGMAAMMVFNYELRETLKNQLTPEQQAELKQQMEKRMEKMKQRRQDRMEGRHREG